MVLRKAGRMAEGQISGGRESVLRRGHGTYPPFLRSGANILEKMRGRSGDSEMIKPSKGNARGVFEVRRIVQTRPWNSTNHFYGWPL